MKKLINIIIASILFTGLFAQQNKTDYDEVIQNAPYIIEGEILDNYQIIQGKNNQYFLSYQLKIEHTFRGSTKLKSEIIEIVTELPLFWSVVEFNGKLETLILPPSHQSSNDKIKLEFAKGSKGIFFCDELGEFPSSNNFAIKPYCPYADCHINIFNQGLNKLTGLGKTFQTKEEMYSFLENQGNIKIPVEEKKKAQPDKKKDADGSGAKTKENQTKYAERVKNVQQYEQYLQQKIAKQYTKANDACKEFFISEYIDGPNAPNKNKVLEIYNPSDSVKSLNGYSIKIFNNGAPTPLDIPLYGNVNPKETRVITHPNAHPDILAKADQTDVNMNFDGNDAIVLNKGQSTYIDKIGEIGVNPGQGGWMIPPNGSTKERDLRRKQPIDKGETDWNQGKNQWDVHPKDSIQNIKQHQNNCSAAAVEDVYYTFANPIESGTNPKYFEFDIMVEGSSSNTYLDNAAFFIQYNTSAFGSNVVANNKITITAGGNFNSATYVNPNTTIQDDATDVFNFYIGSDFNAGAWNRTNVTQTPQQLVHIKIEIVNCNQNTSLQVINQAQTSNVSFYTDNATEDFFGTLFSYDNTNYTNTLFEQLCVLKITNFSPNPITAGTGSVLTIQGSGFGAARGNGQVALTNGDNGGSSFIRHLDYIDYVSWTDNEIKIKVPSTVDTLSATLNNNEFPPAGTGLFYVKTNSGDSTFSTSNLTVSYCIINARQAKGTPNFRKIRVDLVDPTPLDLDTGIVFYLDTSITNVPMREAVVRKALHDWSCATGVFWSIKGDTTLQGEIADGISLIYMDDSFHGQPLARTSRPSPVICSGGGSIETVFSKEIDLAISRDMLNISGTGWFYDTTLTADIPTGKHDFYGVVAHELGHGHALDHVNNPSDLMFWSSPLGFVSSSSKPLIFTSPDAIDGGLDVMLRSTTLNLSSCSDGATMIPLILDNCTGGSTGLKNIFKAYDELIVYPNPSQYEFNIAYNLKRNTNIEFKIYDYTGKEIFKTNKVSQQAGQYSQQIQMNNHPTGLYFLVANIGGQLQTMKIIKQ